MIATVFMDRRILMGHSPRWIFRPSINASAAGASNRRAAPPRQGLHAFVGARMRPGAHLAIVGLQGLSLDLKDGGNIDKPVWQESRC